MMRSSRDSFHSFLNCTSHSPHSLPHINMTHLLLTCLNSPTSSSPYFPHLIQDSPFPHPCNPHSPRPNTHPVSPHHQGGASTCMSHGCPGKGCGGDGCGSEGQTTCVRTRQTGSGTCGCPSCSHMLPSACCMSSWRRLSAGFVQR